MFSTYCDNCGVIHDTNDGDCLGCEMQARIDELEKEVAMLNGRNGNFTNELQTKLDRAVEVLKELDDSFGNIELLARNIVDQCNSWENLSECTPAQLGKDQKEYIANIYAAYEIIEKNTPKQVLKEIETKPC